MRIHRTMSLPAAALTALLAAFALTGFAAEDPDARPAAEPFVLDGIEYSVASWPTDGRGNHRALVRVETDAPAVRVVLPWRRSDGNPAAKDVRVFSEATGERVLNVLPIRIEAESGEIVFQPADGPGVYAVYWLPYDTPDGPFSDKGAYYPPAMTAEADWLAANDLSANPPSAPAGLPEAGVLAFQSRTDLDRRHPMLVVATAEETETLLASNPGERFLLFAENRVNGISLRDKIPASWARRGAFAPFVGEARPGEFYSYQVGVWAARGALENLSVTFSPLTGPGGDVIAPGRMTCLNLGGIDDRGQPLSKAVDVPRGEIEPLWMGIDVPDFAAGTYTGTVTIQPEGGEAREIPVTLTISGELLADGGVQDNWRLARLQWLNSTLNLDRAVAEPYEPVALEGETVSVLDRTITFDATGLPTSLTSRGREILAAPIEFRVETAAGRAEFLPTGEIETIRAVPNRLQRRFHGRAGDIEQTADVSVESEGVVFCEVTLRADREIELRDVKLVLPVRREVGRFMMGFRRRGGFCPDVWRWTWRSYSADNDCWLGDGRAGVQLRLAPEGDPYIMDFNGVDLPPAWYNEGRGGAILERLDDRVEIRAFSGPRTLAAGEELTFRYRLIVTPVKPLDYDRMWRIRMGDGATHNTMHIHHSTPVVPYINYPFSRWRELRGHIGGQRAVGWENNVYYTLREVSQHCDEILAFHALGEEILRTDSSYMYTDETAEGRSETGGGYAWLREHLVDGYIPGWVVAFSDGDVCAAVATRQGRLSNFYIEGLKFLIDNAGMTGLYLDGVAFNRRVMQRAAKTLQRGCEEYRINFHGGDGFSGAQYRVNTLNKILEHVPFLTSLWFGEGFDYNAPADYWLVEISGLPFGISSEMLNYQDGGNQWRGMIFGMDGRQNTAKEPLWRFWDEYGIEDTEMLGWWDPNCPVRATHPDVYATVYRKGGSALIALASWASEDVATGLEIDYDALKLPREGCVLTARRIPAFQDEAAVFDPAGEIPVPRNRGWLLILEPAAKE